MGGDEFLMCNECYENSYLDYPAYVHPPAVRDADQYGENLAKIVSVFLGMGDAPKEGESVYEYLVENQDRPRLPFELPIWTAFAGFFALRDGFRSLSKRLDGFCLHPSDIVCAQEAL